MSRDEMIPLSPETIQALDAGPLKGWGTFLVESGRAYRVKNTERKVRRDGLCIPNENTPGVLPAAPV